MRAAAVYGSTVLRFGLPRFVTPYLVQMLLSATFILSRNAGLSQPIINWWGFTLITTRSMHVTATKIRMVRTSNSVHSLTTHERLRRTSAHPLASCCRSILILNPHRWSM